MNNRLRSPMEMRVVRPLPQSMSSSNSNVQRHLDINVRLNVDMNNGKVMLTMPDQGTSKSSALPVELPMMNLTPTDNNPLTNQFMKPATSSTQPPFVDSSSSRTSGMSRQSQRQQIARLQNAYGISPPTQSQQTYCVLCKRGYMPHQFDYHIKIHKESSLKEPANINKPNEKSFIKKQQPQCAIIPQLVMNSSSYRASSRLAGSNVGPERHIESFQPNVKMLHQSNRSHSQHHMHLSSNFSQRGTPNMMIYSNVKSNSNHPSVNIPSSNSQRIINPSSSHVHMSYNNNHISVHSSSHSDKGMNLVQANLQHQEEIRLNTSQLRSQAANDRQSSKTQQSSDVRDVHSVPDPSVVDRLSESQDEMLWQSMMVEGTDYKYDRIKRQLQAQQDTVMKDSAISGSLKQKAPKNLLAMEMAIEQKKQQQNLEASRKQNPQIT